MSELRSAWAFGPYRRGQGDEGDDPRLLYAVGAIKRELVYIGYDLDLTSQRFGPKTGEAVKAFQTENGLTADGMVGSKTANALWRRRITETEASLGIPQDWLRAQIHWESLDDPGAQLTNPDGSRDRGLCQLNSGNHPDDTDAFDPAWSIPFLGRFQAANAKDHRDCKVNKWKLAVASWRTPVGADEWCDQPDLEPKTVADGGTWGQQAAYYCDRVATIGRMGWVG
jgi:hypothetical protein